MKREQVRTQVRQWPYGEQLATTVHRFDDDGNESIELTGVNEKLDLKLEDRGHEMVLPERAR